MTLSSVLGMFAKSPIRPIEEHMAKAQACAAELIPFTKALHDENWEAAKEHQTNISRLEREADDLKRELRLNLPKGIFLPVPRTDLLELVTVQDEIANKSEDIAGLMFGRKMKIPPSLEDTFNQFVQLAIDASIQANQAINELDELMESSFKGAEVQIVEDMITKLQRIESDSDAMQIVLRQKLFEIEATLPPVEVIFLYKIIELIGELADTAQRVGNRLELLMAH